MCPVIGRQPATVKDVVVDTATPEDCPAAIPAVEV